MVGHLRSHASADIACAFWQMKNLHYLPISHFSLCIHLWLNFHQNYHHASSSISRVTNFSKMHLIQQTTIIIHVMHIIWYFHFPNWLRQSDYNGSWFLECPKLTGRYLWYFPGRYLEYFSTWIKRMFPVFQNVRHPKFINSILLIDGDIRYIGDYSSK